MSRKFNFIPHISDYAWVREQMAADLTLGDMYMQKSNRYQDGYSNIIIHPDGRVATNWR